MHKLKEGDLQFGRSDSIVTNPKQVIALSELEEQNITKN